MKKNNEEVNNNKSKGDIKEKVKNKKPSAEKLAKIDQMLAELDQQKNSSDKKQ